MSVVAATWVACGELGPIEPDRCGNTVVERGEDCDTFEDLPGGERCVPDGLPAQCRYSCALKDDGVERYACPDGWGCGSDDICRRHSGSFDVRYTTGQPVGRWFDVADFDGDGNPDVVSVSDAAVSIDYLDAGVYRESHRVVLEAEGLPSVADADGDGLADLLTPSLDGLSLLRGSTTRTLLPTTFASIAIPLDELFVFVSADLVPGVAEVAPGAFQAFPGDEAFVITSSDIFSVVGFVPYAINTLLPGSPNVEIDLFELEGRPVVGRFDETPDTHGAYHESGEQVVLATADQVTLLRPSWAVVGGLVRFYLEAPTEVLTGGVPPSHPLRTSLMLPAGLRVNAVQALQANRSGSTPGLSRWPCGGGYAPADEHLDLVITGYDDNDTDEVRTVLAFGLGDGRFHSDPCELGEVEAMTLAADDAFATPAWLEGCDQPLVAMGDVDGDGAPDVVTSNQSHLSGRVPAGAEGALGICSALTAFTHPENTVFREAVIADFDGDGLGDIVAGNDEPGIDFLTVGGGESLLRHIKHVTVSPVQGLRVSDFDGDGLADVAFAEARGDEATVSVLFGEKDAVPQPPRLVAAVADLIAVETSRQPREGPLGLTDDGPEDLLIATPDPSASGFRLAALYGRADRRLQAPFVYSLQGVDEAPLPPYLPYGAAIAPFDVSCAGEPEGDANPQVAFVTGSLSAPGFELPPTNMGSACVDERTQFTVAESVTSDLGLEVAEQARATAVIPFSYHDPMGGPEDWLTVPIVAAFNFFEGSRSLAFSLPTPTMTEQGLVWDRGPSAVVEGVTVAGSLATELADPTSLIRAWSPNLNNVPSACSLWPDQDPAVVFLTIRDDGACPDTTPAIGAPAKTVLQVVPSASVLGIRQGSLSGAHEIGTDDGETIVGFACLNLDEDAPDEVAVLTLLGEVAQCEIVPEAIFTAQLRLLEVDDSGTPVLRPTPIASIPATDLVSTDPTTPPASGLAATDFNGDGVDDIFVATPTNGFVWLGKPVAP